MYISLPILGVINQGEDCKPVSEKLYVNSAIELFNFPHADPVPLPMV